LIGLVAGVLVIEAAFFVESTLKIDDPVGAVAVHGFNGAWGCLALGLFADGTYGDGWNGVPGTVTGLFYGNASQFVAQCIGVGTNIVAIGILGFVVFKAIDLVVGLLRIRKRRSKVWMFPRWVFRDTWESAMAFSFPKVR
jgi:Amt family ammonium transporter